MNVLLVGHAMSPRRGSEPGFTWHWAQILSARHSVWVLAQPEFREEVEEELRREPIPNLKVVWVDLPRILDPWQLSGGRIGIGLHYLAWQQIALRRATALHAEIGFDLVHHVSLGTVSAPPKLWRLGIPFIWGPIGGGQTSPVRFSKYFRGERTREWLRGLRLRLLPLSPAFRNAARRSQLILATNRETIAVLRQAGASCVQASLDGALPAQYVPGAPIVREPRKEITFLWVGSFEPRKGLPLALEALAQTEPGIRLLVAGGGRKRAEWHALAISLGLGERVQFLGKISWEELRTRYREADGFLFTSIRDTFGTVILEAMAHALPVIALDHQGVAAHVGDDAAIKVAVTHPAETIAAIAAAMSRLASSPELRERLGRAGWEFARAHTWERRAVQLDRSIYSPDYDRSPRMLKSHYILGTKVHATSYAQSVEAILGWATAGQSRYVCAANVHMVMEGYDSDTFRSCVNHADLVTPDGMPLVWMLRQRGEGAATRVYGPDLTLHLLEAAQNRGIPVGFLGGRPEVLQALLRRVAVDYPRLRVAYSHAPPFRSLSGGENAAVLRDVAQSGAQLLFVGLGCPKQESWMAANSSGAPVVMVGVGAAFDFLSGSVRQAPQWMRGAGLEWAFRFAQEPRRLWHRYFKHNSRFLILALTGASRRLGES